MKRILLFFIVLSSTLNIYSQGSISITDKPFILDVEKDDSIVSFLSKNEVFNKQTAEEKDIIYWLNYVRMHPYEFNEAVFQPFLTQFPEIKNSYTKSLIADLKKKPSIPLLTPNKKLTPLAANHAQDLGNHSSFISHSSSSGQNFQERVNAFGSFECISENIYEGKNKAIECVLFLLIDNGVKTLGHRKNILDPNMKYVGVSSFPIAGRKDQYFIVQDFSCSP